MLDAFGKKHPVKGRIVKRQGPGQIGFRAVESVPLDSIRKEIRRHYLESASVQLPGVDPVTGRQVQDPSGGDEFFEAVADIVMDVPAPGESF
jgi:hypothetical protein